MTRSTPVFEFAGFTLDPAERRLTRDGTAVALTPKAFDLLIVLVNERGHLLTKDVLLKRVWPDSFVEEANLSHHVYKLREALGDGGDGTRLIETVPRRGYRFIGDVVEHLPVPAKPAQNLSVLPVEIIATEETGARIVIERHHDHGTPSRTWLAIAALAIAGVVVAAVSWRSEAGLVVGDANVRSLVVLPFKPLGTDGRDAALELGMADALITRLSNIRELAVRPTSAVTKYAAGTHDSAAVAREQGADAWLEGTLQRTGERLRVTVQLVRTSDGSTFWGRQFDEPIADILAVQQSIAEQVAASLAPRAAEPGRDRLARPPTQNVAAFQDYMQGRYFLNRRSDTDLQHARRYFQDAIAKDPRFALAHAALADTYYVLGFSRAMPPQQAYTLARQSALAALAIDDELAEAHTPLARLMSVAEGDHAGSEREFKRALAINPSYPTAHHWYSRLLMEVGRLDEAAAEARRAWELDPQSLIVTANAGEVMYFARRHDDSITFLLKAREMDPKFRGPFIAAHLFLNYVNQRMYPEAATELGQAFLDHLGPERAAQMGATLRRGFEEGGERRLWDLAATLLPAEAGGDPNLPMHMAEVERFRGNADGTIAWLAKAVDAHHVATSYMDRDPDWASIRHDPRFQALVARARESDATR